MKLETLELQPLTISELAAMLHQYKDNHAVSVVIKRVLQRRLSDVGNVRADKAV